MECYINSFRNFHVTRQCRTTDYSLILDALDSQRSTVTVDGDDISGSTVGSWLILNGVPMWITQVTPGKGLTKLTLAAAEEIFNRQLLADFNEDRTEPEWHDATVGGFIARIISREWINQADSAYATPYISVQNLDNTLFFAPETDENGIYNLLEYIYTARQNYNLKLIWTVERDGLRLTITRTARKIHPLILNDGHTQLASSSFAQSIVSKITVIQPVEIPEPEEIPEGEEDLWPQFEITTTDWYLTTDGTATTTVPPNRAEGEWVTIVAAEGDDQAELVQEEFALNGESHKVELYSDVQMEVGDRFRVKLNGQLFEGTVIRKQRKRGDIRTLYTSGELITTIQERVHQTAAAQQGGYTGDGTGQMYAVGDIYITTRQGNPAQLLGYGAWEQIQGRFLYAVDGDHDVKSRGGKAEVTLDEDNLPSADYLKSTGLTGQYMARVSGSPTQYNYITGTMQSVSGAGKAFEILPPFFAVFVWLRKE